MGHYTGPKNRLSRREGLDLFGKANKLRRASVFPGQHGPKGAPRLSEYGAQLREKQKAKRIYGIMERQFRSYFETATRVRGKTGEVLLRLLESRLDNVVYRLGFAKTRNLARQLVSHNHLLVKDKTVNIPSYQVKVGDTLTLSPIALEIPHVQTQIQNPEFKPPAWLARQAAVGKVLAPPGRGDVDEPINEQLIVEFYSR
jgi:small subunit ribosomal protein S4